MDEEKPPFPFTRQDTPLTLALKRGNDKITLFLIRNGANVDVMRSELQDEYEEGNCYGACETQYAVNQTPLHLAIQYNASIEVIRALIEHSANTQECSDEKRTCCGHFWLCCLCESLYCITLGGCLIWCCFQAEKNKMENYKAITPLEYARRMKRQDVVDLLLNHQQSENSSSPGSASSPSLFNQAEGEAKEADENNSDDEDNDDNLRPPPSRMN